MTETRRRWFPRFLTFVPSTALCVLWIHAYAGTRIPSRTFVTRVLLANRRAEYARAPARDRRLHHEQVKQKHGKKINPAQAETMRNTLTHPCVKGGRAGGSCKNDAGRHLASMGVSGDTPPFTHRQPLAFSHWPCARTRGVRGRSRTPTCIQGRPDGGGRSASTHQT